MPCQGISPLMKIAAGFSAAIFATKACRATGLVAPLSVGEVNRMSPYATSTSGSGRSASRTVNVVAAWAGAARARARASASAIEKIKTMGTAPRIARCYAKETFTAMRFIFCTVLCALATLGAAEAVGGAAAAQDARWLHHAENVLIVRDNWGIAHVYGKSDADAVFGMIYAQAEDDFGRVERNYLNGLGLLAQAEGEPAVYSDLRQRLFIDPIRLQAQYRGSPAWLKELMGAWADGLNYFLAKHPAVAPKVIRHFEPWMALSFTEGSIGGDIEGIDLAKLTKFYGAQDSQIPRPTQSSALARTSQPLV